MTNHFLDLHNDITFFIMTRMSHFSSISHIKTGFGTYKDWCENSVQELEYINDIINGINKDLEEYIDEGYIYDGIFYILYEIYPILLSFKKNDPELNNLFTSVIEPFIDSNYPIKIYFL